MPVIKVANVAETTGTTYPPPHDAQCQNRHVRRLSNAFGLTKLGFNLMRLPPGVWSSQRHWHSHEDEFVYMLEGELVLVSDAGEDILRAGDCIGWPAGARDGHHLVNRSDQDAVYLCAGNRHAEDVAVYSDIDMKTESDRYGHFKGYVRRDGTALPEK